MNNNRPSPASIRTRISSIGDQLGQMSKRLENINRDIGNSSIPQEGGGTAPPKEDSLLNEISNVEKHIADILTQLLRLEETI